MRPIGHKLSDETKQKISVSHKKRHKYFIYECLLCGKEKTVVLSRRKVAKFCSNACRAKFYAPILTQRYKGKKRDLSDEVRKKMSQNAIKVLISMKKTMTNIEKTVATILDNNKYNYLSQFKVCGLVVDFFLPEQNLIVECDGDYWHSGEDIKVIDLLKTKLLEQNGYKILRLSESLIKKDKEKCLQLIKDKCSKPLIKLHSVGELFDLLIISSIKLKKFGDSYERRRKIRLLIDILEKILNSRIVGEGLVGAVKSLCDTNFELWEMESLIRDADISNIERGELVFRNRSLNDRRIKLKNSINKLLDYAIEEKDYKI